MAGRIVRARVRKGRAGEEIQTRLIEAGLDLFSSYGFDGVSTRMLADAANANLASIQYHFGGKDGLHLAVVRHITDEMGRDVLAAVAEIEDALVRETPSQEACFTMLCRLLDILLTRKLSSPDVHRWGRIMVRELMEGGEGLDIIYKRFSLPFQECCCKLVGLILDVDPHDPQTKLLMFAIGGQIFTFDVLRTVVMRSLGWQGYSPDELETIRGVVLDNARAILRMPLQEWRDGDRGPSQ
jgi:TetR/AcrR family transcriptional regulator, regulator of cefoperazone and chloramphenicol sensitivity